LVRRVPCCNGITSNISCQSCFGERAPSGLRTLDTLASPRRRLAGFIEVASDLPVVDRSTFHSALLY
jgi:hypothetical protein